MRIPTPRELELLKQVMESRTGREIAAAHEAETGQEVPYGTLYACLTGMYEEGWVTIRQPKTGDRRRRLVRITRAGKSARNRAREHHKRLMRLAT